jgi:hypothetical protein
VGVGCRWFDILGSWLEDLFSILGAHRHHRQLEAEWLVDKGLRLFLAPPTVSLALHRQLGGMVDG